MLCREDTCDIIYIDMAETVKNEEQIEILYAGDGCSLFLRDSWLIFRNGENEYDVTSHGYEPCLYLRRSDELEPVTVHNFLEADDLIRIHRQDCGFTMITGNSYDLEGVCHLLHIAANNGGRSLDIGYLEGQWVLEKLERDGAFSVESAADITGYGLQNVRIMHPFEHSGKVRKTADGKFYLTAKGRRKKK